MTDCLRDRRMLVMLAVALTSNVIAPGGGFSGGTVCAYGQVTQHAPPQVITPEDEVLANLRNQPIGTHTLADLYLPERFLRREADRIIRASFEERHRVVVKDPRSITQDGHFAGPAPSMVRQAVPAAIDLFEPLLTEDVLAYRLSLHKARPSNRGFKPALSDGDVRWPMHEPSADAEPALLRAASIVNRRLAVDGLLSVTHDVMTALGADRFTHVDAHQLQMLRETGLPVDLLDHFTLPDGTRGFRIIERLALFMTAGQSMKQIRDELQRASFRFNATMDGFAVADDAGSVSADLLRAQITRGGYWRGKGDGSTTDLIRQVIDALPEARMIASVDVKHARGFADVAATWPMKQPAQLMLVVEPLEVQQWTQDNAKNGIITSIDGIGTQQNQRRAMLVPRYASWGDDGSTFVPGEMFLLPGVAEAAGAVIVHSPLLFQGGNVMCVMHPSTGQRLLLIADADVYRNTALGLTVEQVLEAFRVEFGCDRCEMLEAVSFHLDYDVSIRAVDDRLVAMVNDPLAAARIILETCTGAMLTAGLLTEPLAREAVEALRRGDHRGFLDRVAPMVYAAGPDGRFPLSLAEKFARSPMDSSVGNMHRFLLALDYLASLDLKPEEWPSSRHARSYLLSLQRRERDREALHQRLGELGLEVHPVPSMSDATRGFAYLNCVQTQTAVLLPTYGGLFSSLDIAARRAVSSAIGDGVRIVSIECSESMRRSGAVRCSIAIFPPLSNPVRVDETR